MLLNSNRDISFVWKKYPKRQDEPYIDVRKTHQYLRSSGLNGVIEGIINVAHDQCLPTKVYKAKIKRKLLTSPCHLCNKFD